MTFRTEIVAASPRLTELDRPWQDLWRQAEANVFQSHPWIATWWRSVAERPGYRLVVALAWSDDRLVGVLPLAIDRQGHVRMLRWAAELFSDYCDALIEPGQESWPVLAALWECVVQAGGFDVVSLRQVRPDARARPLLDAIAERAGRPGLEQTNRCLGISRDWPDGQAFFRSLGKKGRNNHTRGKRILAELGGEVAFRCYGPEQPLSEVLDQLLALKRDWLRANDPGSPLLGLDGEVVRALLDAAAASDQLRAFTIECDEKLVAASANFLRGDTMQAYLTSYDAAFGRASPGTILIVDYTLWAFDRGMRYVDFLRGDEAFKLGMANGEVSLSGVAAPRTLLGRTALAVHGWRARARERAPGLAALVRTGRWAAPDKPAELVGSESEGL